MRLERLDRWREDKGWTMKVLGSQLGMSRQRVSLLITGQRRLTAAQARQIVELSRGELTLEDLTPDYKSGDVGVDSEDLLPEPAPLTRITYPVETGGLTRLCVDVSEQLVERLRDIVWWHDGRVTLKQLVTLGVDYALRIHNDVAVELRDPDNGRPIYKRAGEPYPARRGAVPVGRRVT